MKKTTKIKTIFSTMLLLMTFPMAVSAFSLPFGGYNVFSAPCTCSPTVVYVWYWPFLPLSPVAGAPMAVAIPPTGIWYQNYDPVLPTTWSLGKYFPGVQGCWQYAGTACYPWPVVGYVYQVGSSLPLKK
jgi:hypothetical protein